MECLPVIHIITGRTKGRWFVTGRFPRVGEPVDYIMAASRPFGRSSDISVAKNASTGLAGLEAIERPTNPEVLVIMGGVKLREATMLQPQVLASTVPTSSFGLSSQDVLNLHVALGPGNYANTSGGFKFIRLSTLVIDLAFTKHHQNLAMFSVR
ncbi:hypothetical protein JAAARDRAFT_203915 [Jaapia argillacea MUCL 33604]|uniref:Uncharacterized protein n=1 Tax=Jaapia argillacea MUCL 33604 TaxID=933084 RepID=A0A067QCZ9_9AGAM|nr:hypothetical protein JAAARDRAFT_203915 [Jaapia argillacea MUCL 33604]